MNEKAFDLYQKLSDAEMLAIIDMCSRKCCPFARAGVCDGHAMEGAKCVFTELKEFCEKEL